MLWHVKSWAGSIACMAAGLAAAAAFLLHFCRLGLLPADLQAGAVIWKSLLTATIAAAVEALPIDEYDNLTIAVSAASVARLLYGF